MCFATSRKHRNAPPQVDVVKSVPLVRGGAFQGRLIDNPGIVDEDVNRTHGASYRRNHLHHGVLPRLVEVISLRPAIGFSDGLRRSARAVEIDIGDGDTGARRRKIAGNSIADAFGATGDNRHLAGQVKKLLDNAGCYPGGSPVG